MPEYLMKVYEQTSELFYLLEAAECIKTRVERGERETYNGFGPSSLSITIQSVAPNVQTTIEAEYGHSGRLAQLAYVGWIAAVDGLWEQYRTNPPFDRNDSGLKHGQQADLFGDLHKIRNDLLKHQGIAQARNTGRCVVLRWFRTGERMQMSLEHVLCFLHQLGGYMGNFHSRDGRLLINWHLKDNYHSRLTLPYRVISNRISIWDIPPEEGTGFGLFHSMMFADGIASTVLVRRSRTAAELEKEMFALRSSPLDQFGAVIHPDVGQLDVRRMYQMAKQAILGGEVPADPGTPRIQFRNPNPNTFEPS